MDEEDVKVNNVLAVACEQTQLLARDFAKMLDGGDTVDHHATMAILIAATAAEAKEQGDKLAITLLQRVRDHIVRRSLN